MKFSVGDVVEVIGTGERAEVVECQYKRIIDKRTDIEIERYLIKIEDEVFPKYRNVKDLKDWLEIRPETNDVIDKLLIDAHLDSGNIAAVKEIVEDA